MTKALVLNATYEPLSVVSSRRALVLVWRGRATVVEGREETWRSAERTFVVPSVVRLNYFVKVPFRRTVPLTRRAVFGRDGYACQYCGAAAESDQRRPGLQGHPGKAGLIYPWTLVY